MGILFNAEGETEFATRLTLSQIKKIVERESDDKGAYLGMLNRVNKVDFVHLHESARSAAFGDEDREDWSIGIQQTAALTGKSTWVLQVYVYDDGNRRRIRLRWIGNRDVVGPAKKLARNIERAAS